MATNKEKNTKKTYWEIRECQPELHECFFAFNNEQFDEGKKKANISEDKKIYSSSRYSGLYGTKEGLEQFFADLNAIIARIPKECDPQDVYDEEFDNHECGYVCDDTEAIELVVAFFGEERAKTVRRKYAHVDISELNN